MPKPAKCIVPGCNRKSKWRGVCVACYFEMRKRIKDSEDPKATEANFIKRNMILPPGKRGPKAKNAFAKLCSTKN